MTFSVKNWEDEHNESRRKAKHGLLSRIDNALLSLQRKQSYNVLVPKDFEQEDLDYVTNLYKTDGWDVSITDETPSKYIKIKLPK